ncbi:hypothetical protein [Microvirga puerhi]|uniref:Uncharacterized protein n=1 Tax=Microvirga puerhi TaxID=2876078 RepID=A0ABS7VP36_9HYPH|nr:hypothetical protein [Microvirga puerhi]MBZ6076792.1 hypothetical protein [Microvirga puerhi]
MDAPSAGWHAASSGAPLLGTRFLVYPQAPFIPGYEEPEAVWISTPAGGVGTGPEDRRMYVVDPLLTKKPYQRPYAPPYAGDLYPPAEPGPDGHFDHIPPGSRQFLAAHAFACVSRVIDIAESYLDRAVPWFFQPTYERLEIVPHLAWTNAQSGYGFLELGEDESRDDPFPYALNFDVIAHETGHLILFGILGVPERLGPSNEYLAYHEFAADFVSLIGLMHFDTALDRMLRRTRGNLFISNELDRIAELFDERQIRKASHSLKLSDVGTEVHDLSRPFTGALFDALLEIFQLILLERGLASLDTRQLSSVRESMTQSDIDRELMVSKHDYQIRHFAVKSALQEARDIIGDALLGSWEDLDPDNFSFRHAALALLWRMERGRGRRFADRIEDNFVWREIL